MVLAKNGCCLQIGKGVGGARKIVSGGSGAAAKKNVLCDECTALPSLRFVWATSSEDEIGGEG